MFNKMSNNANTGFNNKPFMQCKMLFMESEKEMHPSMLRFYEAMKALKGVEGQSAAAKVLNMSPQKLNNWEARGISAEAAIDIECAIGCRAAWLRNADGEMLSQNIVIEGHSRRIDEKSLPYDVVLTHLAGLPEHLERSLRSEIEAKYYKTLHELEESNSHLKRLAREPGPAPKGGHLESPTLSAQNYRQKKAG